MSDQESDKTKSTKFIQNKFLRRTVYVLAGLLAIPALLLVGLIIMSTTADKSAYDRTDFDISSVRADFDGDNVPNADDNCVIIANADQRDADGNGLGDACDQVCPNPTIKAIYNGSAEDFDELFLIAETGGPMPGNREAIGAGPKVQPVMYGTFSSPTAAQFLLGGWVGKTFETDEEGGMVYNRMLFGMLDFWPHYVSRGESVWDGKPVINIVAAWPFDRFPDEVRMLEKDVYLGYSLNREDDYHAIVRWALDFRCPEAFDLPWNHVYAQ
ncbi:thrombospondin type 3 repeat-containing protein [Litorivivens sp.]|uniref:thrombospondin type 3 repeat-containing protein n=1 Tax=Litorivivens sp. TaxID=2020868 RepID=UPI0035639219